MPIEGMTPQPIHQAAQMTPSKQKEDAKLQDACQQFETIFLNQLFSQMRKTIPKNDIFGENRDEEMFQGMLDQERAKAWSESGGIGLANVLYQQMKDTNSTAE